MITAKATKKAAVRFVQSGTAQEKSDAVTIKGSFDQIAKVIDLSVPLRRPARRCPSSDAEQAYLDAEAARAALRDAGEVTRYSEFRKEIGMDD